MHSTPKRRDKDKTAEPRINTMPDCSPFKGLPSIDGCEDIASHFNRAGRGQNTSAGFVPLSWSEINAYSTQSAAGLSGWESVQLMEMSRVYTSTLAQANDDYHMPAPYSRDMSDEEWLEWQDYSNRKAIESGNSIAKASKK